MTLDLGTVRLLRVLAMALAAVFALSVAADVFKPLVMAILLAFLLTPLLQCFERFGLPRAVSVGLLLLTLLTVIGGIGYVVGNQFASLADHLPAYEINVRAKLSDLRLERGSAIDKAVQVVRSLEKSMSAAGSESAAPVRIVSETSFVTSLQHLLGPFEVVLTFAGVVLILLTFILIERADISDRIVQLVGWGKIGVTTKTLSLIGHRLSRYMVALSLVNACFGTVVMLGLWAIGLPYPALWGFLAALLRFIPYVGTLASLSLPEMVSIAHFPGWIQPLLVLALFGFAELATCAIEPLVYGKSTGISPTGLLVAALFWTWLWGGLGLLLANVMTVCLAVIGQSVPSLGFLGTLLQHDVNLGADLRWYQTVLNRDQEGALDLLDEALKTRPFEDVCDQIVIPTLARAEQDRVQGLIDTTDAGFIFRVVREWLDNLASRDDLFPPADGSVPENDDRSATSQDVAGAEGGTLIGLVSGGAEALILRMVNLTLAPSGLRLKVLSASGSPLHVSDRVGAFEPALILISHLPPGGLTRARYLIRRLRARYADVPLAVGFWDPTADLSRVIDQLRSASVHQVVLSVAAARTLIVQQVLSETRRTPIRPQTGTETAIETVQS